MKIFGSICVGIIGLGSVLMFIIATQPVTQYDYIGAILFSIAMLVCFLALFVAITATGKLDFLHWPRFLQFGGAAVACLSLTVVMGMSAALKGSGGREFPCSIRPFCPWAAFMVPLAIAFIGFLWLHSERFNISEQKIRKACGVITAIALLSNIVLVLELGLHR